MLADEPIGFLRCVDALVESDGEVRRPTILRSVSDVYGTGEFEDFEEFRIMVWESFREDAPMLFRRSTSDPRVVATWEDSTGRVVLEEVIILVLYPRI